MPTHDGYPTEDEIKKLKRLCKSDFFYRKNIDYFLDYLRDIWWMADWGFKLTGKRTLKLRLSTAGWSGNEEIIGILSRSNFWLLYWVKSERGGHYFFNIPYKKEKEG